MRCQSSLITQTVDAYYQPHAICIRRLTNVRFRQRPHYRLFALNHRRGDLPANVLTFCRRARAQQGRNYGCPNLYPVRGCRQNSPSPRLFSKTCPTNCDFSQLCSFNSCQVFDDFHQCYNAQFWQRFTCDRLVLRALATTDSRIVALARICPVYCDKRPQSRWSEN